MGCTNGFNAFKCLAFLVRGPRYAPASPSRPRTVGGDNRRKNFIVLGVRGRQPFGEEQTRPGRRDVEIAAIPVRGGHLADDLRMCHGVDLAMEGPIGQPICARRFSRLEAASQRSDLLVDHAYASISAAERRSAANSAVKPSVCGKKPKKIGNVSRLRLRYSRSDLWDDFDESLDGQAAQRFHDRLAAHLQAPGKFVDCDPVAGRQRARDDAVLERIIRDVGEGTSRVGHACWFYDHFAIARAGFGSPCRRTAASTRSDIRRLSNEV